MSTREITVTDLAGVEGPALLLLCDRCGGDGYLVYLTLGGAAHLQCRHCGAVLCMHDGPCSQASEPFGLEAACPANAPC